MGGCGDGLTPCVRNPTNTLKAECMPSLLKGLPFRILACLTSLRDRVYDALGVVRAHVSQRMLTSGYHGGQHLLASLGNISLLT